MTKTTNYQLPKWEKTDRIQMEDFNDMTATLDAALKANADAAAAASAAGALCGNCKIETSTYTGNGKYGSANPTTLTFPKKPTAVAVFGTYFFLLLTDKFTEDKAPMIYYDSNTYWDSVYFNWQDGTVRFYESSAVKQGNMSGFTYQVIALYAQDK